jgi:hypothetical protein
LSLNAEKKKLDDSLKNEQLRVKNAFVEIKNEEKAVQSEKDIESKKEN